MILLFVLKSVTILPLQTKLSLVFYKIICFLLGFFNSQLRKHKIQTIYYGFQDSDAKNVSCFIAFAFPS